MIGYKLNNDKVIGVDFLPGRVKPCLVVVDGNCETKYASFNNEYSAMEFMDIFADAVGAPKIDWKNDPNAPMLFSVLAEENK